MNPNSKSRKILDDWDAVASSARRPATAPRRRGLAGLSSMPGLIGAGLLAAALVVAISWLGGRTTGVGGEGTPGPTSPIAVATEPPPSASPASPSPAPTPTPTSIPPTPEPTPSATPVPTPVETVSCVQLRAEGKLDVQITRWEGAAGSRIADVSMTNHAKVPCAMYAQPRPDLVDHAGKVLVRGSASPTGAFEVKPGQTVTTLVDVSNVCEDNPRFPLTVAFEEGADGRIIADPESPTDTTVPPCNGPGQPADISMHPWSS